jgi:hypothetical protein
MLLDLFSTNTDWLQTVIRVTLGVVFFAHGALWSLHIAAFEENFQ